MLKCENWFLDICLFELELSSFQFCIGRYIIGSITAVFNFNDYSKMNFHEFWFLNILVRKTKIASNNFSYYLTLTISLNLNLLLFWQDIILQVLKTNYLLRHPNNFVYIRYLRVHPFKIISKEFFRILKQKMLAVFLVFLRHVVFIAVH